MKFYVTMKFYPYRCPLFGLLCDLQKEGHPSLIWCMVMERHLNTTKEKNDYLHILDVAWKNSISVHNMETLAIALDRLDVYHSIQSITNFCKWQKPSHSSITQRQQGREIAKRVGTLVQSPTMEDLSSYKPTLYGRFPGFRFGTHNMITLIP